MTYILLLHCKNAQKLLSSYSYHANLSMSRQDVVQLSYLKRNKHVVVQEKGFLKQDFVSAISNANANERTVPSTTQ